MLNKTARMKKNVAFHVHGKLLVIQIVEISHAEYAGRMIGPIPLR